MTIRRIKEDKIEFDGIDIYVIRKTRIKNITIRIKEAQVRLTVPFRIPQAEWEELLKERRDWIFQKITEQQRGQNLAQRDFLTGESFLFLGDSYKLCVFHSNLPTVRISGDRLEIYITKRHSVKKLLERWYVSQASAHLPKRVEHFANLMGLVPGEIIIKRYKARWGTCYPDGSIAFNWKLMALPHTIIDYVVVHELAHLVHFDHSLDFWHLVEEYIPQYRLSRHWLKFEAACFDYFR